MVVTVKEECGVSRACAPHTPPKMKTSTIAVSVWGFVFDEDACEILTRFLVQSHAEMMFFFWFVIKPA